MSVTYKLEIGLVSLLLGILFGQLEAGCPNAQMGMDDLPPMVILDKLPSEKQQTQRQFRSLGTEEKTSSWRNVWKSPTWDMVQFHHNVFIRRSWSGQEPKLIKRSTILCNIWNITNNYVLATGEDDAKGSMSELYQWLNPVKKGSEEWNQETPHGKPLQVVVTQHIDSDSRGLHKSPRLEALSWGRKDAGSLPDVQLPNRCKQSKYQSKFEQEQVVFSICLISHASLELGELPGKDALRWMCPDEFLHHGNPILYGSGVAGVVGKHTGSSIWCTPQQPPERFLKATRKHRNQLVTIECAEHKNPLMAALKREVPWLCIDSTP